ncbi:hypothetical protein [Paraclostridium bifermentans]|uniref:hypothetical protein n=1 Tax=Paraclostridium bifermentans TaxID=1490 RepID=UPI001FF67745|nr:hypothetical protein [Paraclostridium bifermentans]UOW69464.1 hypothetical protein MTR78_15780 [Paraclostridium bifermentans]
MIKQFKSSFFQIFSITFIWVLLLISIFLGDVSLSVKYTWNLVCICAISSIIFGVMYPALWNFSSLKAFNKIAISSIINTLGGIITVWLFSPDMFIFIKPWILSIFILTIIGHVIGFYFYSKWDNTKTSEELNNLLKK